MTYENKRAAPARATRDTTTHEPNHTALPAGAQADDIGVYEACPLKRRRATSHEMQERRDALVDIVAGIAPCTVRQTFYQATVRGIVDKSEAGYGMVQRMLVELRRSGAVSYGQIVDNTRWMRKPATFDSLQEALDQTAAFYRRSIWPDADDYVEMWLEKDALAGVVYPVTAKWDVPLMVARGYASLSFLATAAEAIIAHDRPTYIYHLGDFDPSGVNAGEKIEETLRELAPAAEIHFQRIAVNEEQIATMHLPSRPTKVSDSRAAKFGRRESVELDAMHPEALRTLVDDAIVKHVDAGQLAVIKTAEASERGMLRMFAREYRESDQ